MSDADVIKIGGKICTRVDCKHEGKVQPLDSFNKNTKAKDGYQYHCKTCQSDYDHEINLRRRSKKWNVKICFYDNRQDLKKYKEWAKLEGRTVEEQMMKVLLENMRI